MHKYLLKLCSVVSVTGSVIYFPTESFLIEVLYTFHNSLQALSKTLTVEELFYLKEQFALLEPNKNGSICLDNIKQVNFLQNIMFVSYLLFE